MSSSAFQLLPRSCAAARRRYRPAWNRSPRAPSVGSNGTAVEVARPAGPPTVTKAGKLPSKPAKTGASARIGVLQRVTFTTGFSYAAREIAANPALELLHQPQYGCVVFRYRGIRPNAPADILNRSLRRQLFERGVAVVGHTRVQGRECLKLTCLNPTTGEDDLRQLVEDIVEQGRALEACS